MERQIPLPIRLAAAASPRERLGRGSAKIPMERQIPLPIRLAAAASPRKRLSHEAANPAANPSRWRRGDLGRQSPGMSIDAQVVAAVDEENEEVRLAEVPRGGVTLHDEWVARKPSETRPMVLGVPVLQDDDADAAKMIENGLCLFEFCRARRCTGAPATRRRGTAGPT